MENLDWTVARSLYRTDLLFFTLQWVLSRVTHSPTIFLLVVWLIFLFGILVFLKKLFEPRQLVLVFFTYACFGFFYSYATIALRQGLALAFVFLLIGYYLKSNSKQWLKIILLFAVASLFHWSAIPFAIILLVLHLKEIRYRYILFTWLFFSVLYVFQIQDRFLSPVVRFIPDIEDYTSSQVLGRYVGGTNRLDFLLFSFFWIALSVCLYYLLNKDQTYKKIIKIYTSFNIVFLSLGFAAFSDRIAGYSWMLIPVLIWYPILKSEKDLRLLSFSAILIILVVGYLTNTLKYLIPFYSI